MWIFTKYGFFSAVCARQGDGSHGCPVDVNRIMVRARRREHLQLLMHRFEKLLSSETDIHESGNTDYRYRIFLDKPAWTSILAAIGTETDYDNFKSEAHNAQTTVPGGKQYVGGLSKIWSLMHGIQAPTSSDWNACNVVEPFDVGSEILPVTGPSELMSINAVEQYKEQRRSEIIQEVRAVSQILLHRLPMEEYPACATLCQRIIKRIDHSQYDLPAHLCLDLLFVIRHQPLPIADLRRRLVSLFCHYGRLSLLHNTFAWAARLDHRIPWLMACDAIELVSVLYRAHRGMRAYDDRVQMAIDAVRKWVDTNLKRDRKPRQELFDEAISSLKSVASGDDDLHSPISNIAWCVEHCEDLRAMPVTAIGHPWWHALFEVARFTPLLSSWAEKQPDLALPISTERWNAWVNQAVSDRLTFELVHWTEHPHGTPVRDFHCGTAAALAWMKQQGITPACRFEDERFEYWLGEKRCNAKEQMRVIEGYGQHSQYGPVYIIRKVENDQLDRKRIVRNEPGDKGYGIEYSALLGFDEQVILALVEKPADT